MTVRVYKSTDASAPVLNGTVGSLIALLDACLVNGYGSQAAAGFTKSFSGTNLAVYRQPASSCQFYLRVDDTGTTDGRMVGYESMTDVSTGTNAFPTNVQIAGGMYVKKSATADATGREWLLFTNGKIFYLWINYDGAVNGASGQVYSFGDFTSYKANDSYACFINAGSSTAWNGTNYAFHNLSVALNTSLSGHYVARNHTGGAVSPATGKISDAAKMNGNSIVGSGGMVYPNAPDAGLYFAPIWLNDTSLYIRGELPGVWCPLHSRPLGHLDTFSGTGAMAGKSFIALNMTQSGQVFFETSNTW